MKRIQKFRLSFALRFALRFVLALLYIALIEVFELHLYKAPQPQYYVFTTLIIIGGVLLVASIFYDGILRKLTLTPEETQTSLVTPADFSNSFSWYSVPLFIIYALTIMIVLRFPMFYNTTHFWPEMSWQEAVEITLRTWPLGMWLILGFVMLYPLVRYILKARNQYILDNETLIIREYRFFRAEPELRIPLDTIAEVKTQYLYTFTPRLYITLQAGDAVQIQRQLYTSSNTLELAVAILQYKQQIQAK